MKQLFLFLSILFSLPLIAQEHFTEADSAALFNLRSASSSQEWDLWINEVAAVNNSVIADEYNEFDDWIEIYNFGDETVDLHGAFITDNPLNPTAYHLLETNPGELELTPGSFIILWADNQPEQGAKHLNFSLSGSGEYLGLFSADDTMIVDQISFGQQISDVTYGRTTDGTGWNFFTTPTPGAANNTPGLFGVVPAPTFSENGIYFSGSVNVSMAIEDPDAVIRYTTDGTTPQENSALYTGPITIQSNTMLRARGFKPEHLPSRVATNTFIEQDDFALDVISLVTDSFHIWGNTGIYDNRYSGMEKPIHIEYFNNSGDLQFEIDGGVKIHAPDSRPQQSLRLYARSDYGDNQINHQIFEDNPVNWFKRLVLRNGGNDGQQLSRTHFRDCLAHEIFAEMDPDNIYSSWKPVNVFLNGQYWGIYNLRERQDRHFIESNFGFDDVDFLERVATTSDSRDIIAGDWDDYDNMRDYLMQNDMADDSHYQVIEDWIDIRNYVDYMVTEIWTANRDWLSNNIKYYRPRNSPEAKWKWVLWDTEYGMGCYLANDHGNPNFDALHMSMSWGGWPPHWGVQNSTYMMNNLKNNDGFVEYFITRHADLLNAWLRPDRVQEKIDEMVALYQDDMPKQVGRWGNSMNQWNSAIQVLENWNNARASWCRQHIMNKWEVAEEERTIQLTVLPDGAGTIKVNTIFTDENPWSGIYFQGVPVNLTAIPNNGFQFVEWIENGSESMELEVWLESDSALTALFEPAEIEPSQLVINEINYKSAPFLDTQDWIEITNAGNSVINLTDWQIRDGNDLNPFTFSEATYLAPGEFIVICEDPLSFSFLQPDVTPIDGPFNFGLNSNGEAIRLYNNNLELIDIVVYGVTTPWPESPDGGGPTLELIDPLLDNALAENWFARETPGGSPGAPNDFLTVLDFSNNVPLAEIFPNPHNGQFTLQVTPEILPVQMTVYSLTGQEISSQLITSNNTQCSIKTEPGMYLVRLQSENNQAAIRIIKY